MNPILERLLTDGWFEHDGAQWPLAHCTDVDICRRYHEFIREESVHDVLEIGTLFGLTTLTFADVVGRRGGHVDTIDLSREVHPWPDGREIRHIHDAAVRHVTQAGLAEVVTFHAGDSKAVLPSLLAAGHRYDFALIDGDHKFPAVLLDFLSVDRMVRIGGYVALDDVSSRLAMNERFNGGPNRVLEAMFSSGRYEITPWSPNVAVCRKLRDP